jgi:hypothetical protein
MGPARFTSQRATHNIVRADTSQREHWVRRGFHSITVATSTAYSKQTLNSYATSVA